MKRSIIAFFILVFSSSVVNAANYFVDSSTGDNGESGATMDSAWATLEHALEGGGLSAGDIVWIRKIHNEIPTSDIAPIYDGSASSPIQMIGWPRDTTTGTATFTNGSASVSAVSITGDREKHCGRRIKCDADGNWYLITRVVHADTFTIDREYAGTTASTAAFTIQADDDYDLAQAIDDAAWTIKKADYNADADDLAVIDFNDGAYQFFIVNDWYLVFKNLELKDSGDANGIIKFGLDCRALQIIGCLMKQTAANTRMYQSDYDVTYMERVILEGSGSGVSQRAIDCGSRALIHLKDCAIYNMGDEAAFVNGNIFLENVNIGVEQANGDEEFNFGSCRGRVTGRDVRLGGAVGIFYLSATGIMPAVFIKIENYNKELGKNKSWFIGGSWQSVAAGAGDPVANQRSGGATKLLEITPDQTGYEFMENWAIKVFKWDIAVTTATKSYRIYVQNAMDLNSTEAADIWFTLKYVKSYDDVSEYAYETKTSVSSSNPMPTRADLDDWGEYLGITSVTPAVASNIIIELYWSKYDASNKCYIDPKLVIE